MKKWMCKFRQIAEAGLAQRLHFCVWRAVPVALAGKILGQLATPRPGKGDALSSGSQVILRPHGETQLEAITLRWMPAA